MTDTNKETIFLCKVMAVAIIVHVLGELLW